MSEIRELSLTEVVQVSGGSLVSEFRQNVEDAYQWGTDIGDGIYDSLSDQTKQDIGGTIYYMIHETTWDDIADYWFG